MFRLVCLLIGYAFGCLQFAYYVGKLVGKIDIREHGSGNAGTTNILRVLGRRAGGIVFVCDILKGVTPFIICSLVFSGGGSFTTGESVLPGLYGGIGAILGHNFPFYLKFKGGKGVATSLGIILCVNLPLAILSFVAGFIVVCFTRYISAASLTILSVFGIGAFVVFGFSETAVLAAFMTVMTFYRHRENITRLRNGNERKFSLTGKKSSV